jgi:hypothetical protein
MGQARQRRDRGIVHDFLQVATIDADLGGAYWGDPTRRISSQRAVDRNGPAVTP